MTNTGAITKLDSLVTSTLKPSAKANEAGAESVKIFNNLGTVSSVMKLQQYKQQYNHLMLKYPDAPETKALGKLIEQFEKSPKLKSASALRSISAFFQQATT